MSTLTSTSTTQAQLRKIIAYLGLGSNIGDKNKNITRALCLINAFPGIQVLQLSRLYRTRPMYVENQPGFLNGVVKIRTRLSCAQLLRMVKIVERKLGRRKRFRYGPREIDIDILLYGKSHVNKPSLTVPHKRMHERSFVLQPLLEVSPGAVHPVLRRRFSSLVN